VGVHVQLGHPRHARGVILAFFLPSRSDVRLSALKGWLNGRAHRLDDTYDDERHVLGQHDFTTEAARVERVMHHVTPPLQRVERTISVPVNFLVLPLFAFVNAQVRVVGIDIGTILVDPRHARVFFGAVVAIRSASSITTYVRRLAFPTATTSTDAGHRRCLMVVLGFTIPSISGLAFANPA